MSNESEIDTAEEFRKEIEELRRECAEVYPPIRKNIRDRLRDAYVRGTGIRLDSFEVDVFLSGDQALWNACFQEDGKYGRPPLATDPITIITEYQK